MKESIDPVKKAAIITLGCRLNQADTALLYDRLSSAGYEILTASPAQKLELLIVNSCAVTASAVTKSRLALRKLRREHPESIIVLSGCMADLGAGEFKAGDAPDIIIPNEGKKDMVAAIEAFKAGRSFSTRKSRSGLFRERAHASFPFKTRAFLKVQEGCEAFCSYCIVPYVRGPERSRDWDEVIADFERALEAGCKEIVLTGVNICTYRAEGRGLPELLDTLASVPGEFRIRLSSTEPHPVNRELIRVMAAHPEKICRFLHLPLQHGTDEILRAMRRSYSTEEYAVFAQEARNLIPGLHLGADIIAGFPGETEALFRESFAFVEKLSFSNLHVFSFSPRPGTPAAEFSGRVSPQIVKQRHDLLCALAASLARAFAVSQMGEPLSVLAERRLRDASFEGWSDNYLHMRIWGEDLARNHFYRRSIKEISPNGEILTH